MRALNNWQRTGFLRKVRVCAVLSALVAGFGASAQDAGVLQQQIERDRALRLPVPRAPEVPALPREMQPSGVRVVVREFRFAGNRLLPTESLAAVVAPFLGRSVDFSELQAAVLAVSNAYREGGWIARVYLPRQEIDAGIVTIQIVEGVFGQTRLEGSPPLRLSFERARRWVDAQVEPAAPIEIRRIERSLLLLDDLPGIAVVGNLAPGAAEGETDLLLGFADTPLWQGRIEIDNTGARSTGAERLAASVALDSPAGIGDQVNGYALRTQGSDYARLAYSLPLGHDGWRAGISASRLDYRVVKGLTAAKLDGDAQTVGLDASYPIVRARQGNLYLVANLDRKHYDNRRDGAVDSRYGIDFLNLALSGNYIDQLGGGGTTSASLGYGYGRLDQGTPDAQENAALARRFGKWQFSANRQQFLTDELSLYAALSGQRSARQLDSAERYYLGGAHSVRAYPSSEAGGDSGHLINLELRWRVSPGLVVTGFYDQGRVSSRDATPTVALEGAGVSVGWQTPFGADLKATWARRIGANPNPLASGADHDGTLIRNRWWLTASLPF